MQAMEISRTGLEVEWRRLEVIAENLANANTTRSGRSGAGEPYRAQRLLSGPRVDFAGYLAGAHTTRGSFSGGLAGVMIHGIEAVDAPPRLVQEPGHPHADAQGFVAYPAIDHAGEMTLMLKTARIYEANVVAIGAARQMYAKAMDLGRRG